MTFERQDHEEALRFENKNGESAKDIENLVTDYLEDEKPMPQNDRATINTPKPYNPYQSPHKLPLLDEEEIVRRGDAYWEKQRAKDFKRGWRQAHPKPFLFVPAVGLFLFVLAIFALGWLVTR